LINALTFIIPAIIGGFCIALLFKYRKKITLKFFFGGALFFAGTFISFFFADSILYLIQTQFYSLFILNYNQFNIELFNLPPFIFLDELYFFVIFCCGLISFWMAFIITSRKFEKRLKNYAILIVSALMGAFLSVILPTFTVIILLVALSIYDIYSVRRGPIKDIVKYTLEDEEKYFNYKEENNKDYPSISSTKNNISIVHISNKIQHLFSISAKINVNNELNNKPKKKSFLQRFKKTSKELDDTDFLLSSMTYSHRDWDVGIGDLVFYSMLASQPLTPYFIFNHGLFLLDKFGIWIFWLICLFTIIGILIGFIITIHLLERNSMLPGLPCSIALGLIGFLGSTTVLTFL